MAIFELGVDQAIRLGREAAQHRPVGFAQAAARRSPPPGPATAPVLPARSLQDRVLTGGVRTSCSSSSACSLKEVLPQKAASARSASGSSSSSCSCSMVSGVVCLLLASIGVAAIGGCGACRSPGPVGPPSRPMAAERFDRIQPHRQPPRRQPLLGQGVAEAKDGGLDRAWNRPGRHRDDQQRLAGSAPGGRWSRRSSTDPRCHELFGVIDEVEACLPSSTAGTEGQIRPGGCLG